MKFANSRQHKRKSLQEYLDRMSKAELERARIIVRQLRDATSQKRICLLLSLLEAA